MAKAKLSRVSTVDLRKELDRRQSQVGALMARRTRLAAELAALDAELDAFGETALVAAPVTRGPGRPPGRTAKPDRKIRKANRGAKTRAENSMTLTASLQKVLKGKTMGVTEVSGAVQKAGYKTNAENFRTIVNQTLIKNPKMFKKVSRGQYTAL